MIVREKKLPAEVGKSKDLPARSAADVIDEMAAKVARYPAKPKEEWEGMSAEEMFQLGMKHYKKEEYSEAAKWCRRAAEQGHAEAQYNLGALYMLGHGVPRNDAEATKWFRRVAPDVWDKDKIFRMFMQSIGYHRAPAKTSEDVDEFIRRQSEGYRRAPAKTRKTLAYANTTARKGKEKQ